MEDRAETNFCDVALQDDVTMEGNMSLSIAGGRAQVSPTETQLILGRFSVPQHTCLIAVLCCRCHRRV